MWAVNVAVFKTYDEAVALALVALFILLALLAIRFFTNIMSSGSTIMSAKTIITLMCPVCAMCVLESLPSSYVICSSLYITEVSRVSPNEQTLVKLIRVAKVLKYKKGVSTHSAEYSKRFATDFPGYEKYLQERAKTAKIGAYFWHNKVKEGLDCSARG